MITEDVIIAAAKGIETADLEGEAVLLDINTGLYYGLSSVGARIMTMLKEPVRVSSIDRSSMTVPCRRKATRPERRSSERATLQSGHSSDMLGPPIPAAFRSSANPCASR